MPSLERKLGHMLMVGFEGTEAPEYLLRWLADGRVGGVILFGRNIENPAQVASMTNAFHQAAQRPIMIAIDQEGGTVARLRESHGFSESPGAMALGAANSEALAEEIADMMAVELRGLGINWNLAPVVDIAHDINNPTIGTRSPGADKGLVSRIASAQIRGFQKAGVAASVKHFPGHGNTPTDTHVELAVVEGALDFLWEHDLVPFRAAVEAGTASVMVSHVKFEALDADYPATLSPAISTGLLRDDVGFTGVACTDCMEMKAIVNHYGPGESAVLAALAGADVIIFSHTFNPDSALSSEVFDALTGAAESGRLPISRIDEANERLHNLQARFAISGVQPDVVWSADHLEISQKVARAGIALLRNDGAVPLPNNGQTIGLVEFSPHTDSLSMDPLGSGALAGILRVRLPDAQTVALSATQPAGDALEQARQLAGKADVLVVATRSAHLSDAQQQVAGELLAAAGRSVLLCLRNPYDAEVLPGADAVLCTFGDSMPSLRAAVDALTGKFEPSGKPPVPVRL